MSVEVDFDTRFLRAMGVRQPEDAEMTLTFTVEDLELLCAQLRQDVDASEAQLRSTERLYESLAGAYERLNDETGEAHRKARRANARVWVVGIVSAVLIGATIWLRW